MSALEEQVGRPCKGANCNARVLIKYGEYCDPCRPKVRRKRKKYVSNDFIDQKLKAIYRESADKKMRHAGMSMKQLATQVRWPKWALLKRAGELGIRRVKETAWSESEMTILERYAWMCPDRIRLKLKAAGFQRTATAVQVKLKRTSAKQNTPYFTANALSQLFGVDSHCITRWINLDYLKADRRGTARHAGNGGDMWLIHEQDVYKFVLARPLEFDIRKVDQLWFMDLVTQGKIATA